MSKKIIKKGVFRIADELKLQEAAKSSSVLQLMLEIDKSPSAGWHNRISPQIDKHLYPPGQEVPIFVAGPDTFAALCDLLKSAIANVFVFKEERHTGLVLISDKGFLSRLKEIHAKVIDLNARYAKNDEQLSQRRIMHHLQDLLNVSIVDFFDLDKFIDNQTSTVESTVMNNIKTQLKICIAEFKELNKFIHNNEHKIDLEILKYIAEQISKNVLELKGPCQNVGDDVSTAMLQIVDNINMHTAAFSQIVRNLVLIGRHRLESESVAPAKRDLDRNIANLEKFKVFTADNPMVDALVLSDLVMLLIAIYCHLNEYFLGIKDYDRPWPQYVDQTLSELGQSPSNGSGNGKALTN